MTSGSWVLPEQLIEHARLWAAQPVPQRQPVPPRRAATVMLLRPGAADPGAAPGTGFTSPPGTGFASPSGADTVAVAGANGGGPEVYLLRRAATMAFASGMYVFPGGTVDPRDAAAGIGWAGPDAAGWADRLGLDPPTAQAVVCAAVRETFEECGVLLAGPDADTVLADVRGEPWQAARRALVAREIGFAEFLAGRGLVLRSDLLMPWARWITPEFEPRRFDTYFFVAALPAEQETGWVCGEADDQVWLPPAAALYRYTAGEIALLPPTEVALRELAPFGRVDEALTAAAGRDPTTPVLPRIEFAADGDARLVV